MALHENASTAELEHFVEQLPLPLRARLAAACSKPHLVPDGDPLDEAPMVYDEEFAQHFVGELIGSEIAGPLKANLFTFIVTELA